MRKSNSIVIASILLIIVSLVLSLFFYSKVSTITNPEGVKDQYTSLVERIGQNGVYIYGNNEINPMLSKVANIFGFTNVKYINNPIEIDREGSLIITGGTLGPVTLDAMILPIFSTSAKQIEKYGKYKYYFEGGYWRTNFQFYPNAEYELSMLLNDSSNSDFTISAGDLTLQYIPGTIILTTSVERKALGVAGLTIGIDIMKSNGEYRVVVDTAYDHYDVVLNSIDKESGIEFQTPGTLTVEKFALTFSPLDTTLPHHRAPDLENLFNTDNVVLYVYSYYDYPFSEKYNYTIVYLTKAFGYSLYEPTPVLAFKTDKECVLQYRDYCVIMKDYQLSSTIYYVPFELLENSNKEIRKKLLTIIK